MRSARSCESGQFAGHCVKPRRQALQFVTGAQVDLMIETSSADARGPLLQLADRPGHTTRKQIGERQRKSRAGDQQQAGAPKRRADRAVSLGSRLFDEGGPIWARDTGGGRQYRAIPGIEATYDFVCLGGGRLLQRAARVRWLRCPRREEPD